LEKCAPIPVSVFRKTEKAQFNALLQVCLKYKHAASKCPPQALVRFLRF